VLGGMCVQKLQPAVAPQSEQHAAGVEECPRLRSWPLKSVPAKVLQAAALELALDLELAAAPAPKIGRRTSICSPTARRLEPQFEPASLLFSGFRFLRVSAQSYAR